MACDIGKLFTSYFKDKSHTYKLEILYIVTKLIIKILIAERKTPGNSVFR